MTENLKADALYAMGYSDEEHRRLIEQEHLFGRHTRRLFQDAGITLGMRVLDVGCGVGDVSMLAAALVGPEGSVVGVDTNQRSLELARRRVAALGLPNVAFLESDLRSLSFDHPFDAVVGRFILMYLGEPSEVLRLLAMHLRSGGIIAFQELELELPPVSSTRTVALEELWFSLLLSTFKQAGVETHMGLKLYQTFVAGNLPAPNVHMDVHLMTPTDLLGPRAAAQVLRSILPSMERFGVGTAEEVAVETFAQRLHADLISTGAASTWLGLVSAWTRKPSG